ncbi:MAG: hypothetical protein NC078_08170 [Ruminococcus sp.]|nr:hypothetical protein [Ruminococcus sp.]
MKKSKKYEAICSLSEALKNQPENEGNLTDIISALEKEPDRKKRKRIMKDFIRIMEMKPPQKIFIYDFCGGLSPII